MSDVALRCTLAGAEQEIFVSTGVLQFRQRGPWLARELACSSPVAPAVGSAATLVCHREDGADDLFVGTVRRATSNPGDETLTVSLVAGAGGLLQQLPPLDHVLGGAYVPAGLVARAICDAAGETLDDGVEEALDAITLPRWHRATDTTASVALDLLTYHLGLVTRTPYSWRVLPSGRVWMGAETWPVISGAAYWTGIDADDGAVLYAVRGAPFVAGQAIDGLNAIEVLYTLNDVGLDVRVRGAVAGDLAHVPDLNLYRGSYSGTVLAQRSDGTIDVRCDDPRIGDLQRLAFRCGLPGALVTFDPSTSPRVRVRFDGASPAGAFAEGADQDPGVTTPAALAAGYLLAGTMTVGTGGAPVVVNLGWSSTPSGPFALVASVPVAAPATPPVGTGTSITTASMRTKLR